MNKQEKFLKEQIVENIRKRDEFYEENIFCVENVVIHTLNYLKKKKRLLI